MQAQESQPTPLPQPPHRYEGIGKVTGRAKYVAEFKEPFPAKDLLYAYMVQSTIPSGTVLSMDQRAAERAPGVVAVLTPFNAPKLQVGKPQAPARRNLTVLQDAEVNYNGQPIALIVARSHDQAMAAASLLNIRYAPRPALLDFEGRLGQARPPKVRSRDPNHQKRGDADQALAGAQVKLEQTYITPVQNHNPLEPHATIAWWEGEKLNVYDTTQYISGVKQSLARVLNLAQDDVHVSCPIVGGGFGSKGSAWSHVVLCAMAAKLVNRPVKLVLGREQMFGPVGARPSTVNMIKIAANRDGKITAIKHDAILHASVLEDFIEESVGPSRLLYQSGSNDTSISMVDLNVGVPTFMRAPGESTGTAVLEIAMDELAEQLKMDPVQLRLLNYAERDLSEDKPWTDKHCAPARHAGHGHRRQRAHRLWHGDGHVHCEPLRRERHRASAAQWPRVRRLGHPGPGHRHVHHHADDRGAGSRPRSQPDRRQARRLQPAQSSRLRRLAIHGIGRPGRRRRL